MDKTTLAAQHPELYAAVLSEGKTEGQRLERDRISAHLTLGEAYNAMDTAVAAAKDGSEMTALISAQYVAAGANNANIKARETDDQDADPGTPDAKDEQETTAAAATAGLNDILSRAGAQLGVEVKEV